MFDGSWPKLSAAKVVPEDCFVSRLPFHCPSCAGPLQAVRLRCTACSTEVEGGFEFPVLLRLSEDELKFVVDFVRASGSLKEMARLRGQSYPTIRSRLDAVIAALDGNGVGLEQQRHAILDAIAKGELSVEDAVKKLRAVES
jgi:hypothetical protein